MARVRVVTDSASDLPADIVERLDIDVVPLTIRFDQDEFSDLSPAEFWAKCKLSKSLPETSAPSPGAFQAAYERAREARYDGVIVLTLSSLLSATHQSATLGAEAMSPEFPVRVVDTLNVSMGQGLIVIDVAEAAAQGGDLDVLVARSSDTMSKIGVVATLDTLEHLIKGGRIGGAKALLGQVLAIKPMIDVKAGVVAEAGRQRTRAKALAAVAALAKAHAPLRRLALIQGACSDADVAALVSLVSDIPTEFPLIMADIGPVVGTHAGPGIIGLTWIEE
ncbi:MAG TPA: DegV family protein [Acidimicrobiales bacterium]|nr:DegV family protein [Acidimicrobiales bacterium]